jgi:hypothetical protein
MKKGGCKWHLVRILPGAWWTLPEIERELEYRGKRALATSISIRMRQLKNDDGYDVRKRERARNLWEYTIISKAQQTLSL